MQVGSYYCHLLVTTTSTSSSNRRVDCPISNSIKSIRAYPSQINGYNSGCTIPICRNMGNRKKKDLSLRPKSSKKSLDSRTDEILGRCVMSCRIDRIFFLSGHFQILVFFPNGADLQFYSNFCPAVGRCRIPHARFL